VQSNQASAPSIVLVEDDVAVLNALTFVFETDGYCVRAYGDAEAFLACAPCGGAACLIVDQHLPGLSGLDLLKHLRARGETVPAILVTSNPSAAAQRQAMCVGVEIIEKPLLGDSLSRRVREMFAMPAAQS